jgi:hypothetical protein
MAQNEAHDVPHPGAESDAHAEFTRSLRNGVGDDPVDPDRRQQ